MNMNLCYVKSGTTSNNILPRSSRVLTDKGAEDIESTLSLTAMMVLAMLCSK